MKKITLSLIAAIATVSVGFSQVNITVVAPPDNGATTNVRAPNATSLHTSQRGCFIVPATELTSLTTGNLTSFGFSLDIGTAAVAVTGNMTLYLQTTANATYLKGTNWPTIITGMTAIPGTLTFPITNNSQTVFFTPTSPMSFPYTAGQGLYVAYDWTSNGPFDAPQFGVMYNANNSMALGGASADDVTLVAPTTLSTTAFRPVFVFGQPNGNSNDVAVTKIIAPGKVAKLLNQGHDIMAEVKNASNVALTNFSVFAGSSGANSYGPVGVLVPNLAAGAVTTVTFPTLFNPQVNGINTITVGVLPDQNNNNNLLTWTQSVTCTTEGMNPIAGTYSAGVGFNTGSGLITNRRILTGAATMESVRVAISNDNAAIGRQVYAVLLDNGGTILATTNTITISGAMAATFQNFTFTTPQSLVAGTYYVGLAQPASTTGYFPLGSVVAPALPSNLYYTSPLAGGTAPNILPTNLGYFGIEPIYTFTNTSIMASATKSMICRGETVTLNAAGGVSTFTWNAAANNASTAAVAVSPTVNTVYSVTGTDGPSGCRSNAASVTVSVSACTGLAVNGVSGSEIKLFPNPAVSGKSTISGLDGTNRIVIFNILGQTVSTTTTSEETFTVDLSGQPNGTYLVKITDSTNNSKTVKIVNQN